MGQHFGLQIVYLGSIFSVSLNILFFLLRIPPYEGGLKSNYLVDSLFGVLCSEILKRAAEFYKDEKTV